ncbi:SOS response-associated peptidase [Martelella sp. HB161492]|uniref:SOS response-associated peptidase n=1 Tax=Martelella sp. HB161492 TaxID=2720726 RepID=UPI00159273B1|nr:SOS response-associated peptidase [Martelella sp. HB161492]
MCGRFGLISDPASVAAYFDLTAIEPFPPRYNIAPSQPVLMIANASDALGLRGEGRAAFLVRWGLIPAWVKDAGDFPLMFNARAETAATKASFRGALRHFRSLVPASGFFEWRRQEDGPSQPFWIRPRDGGLMAFAGLMSPWMGADGTEVDTGTILTTKSSGIVRSIHERAPVIIQPENFERWLDCRTQEPRHVADLMKPVAEDFFEAIPVSAAVNNVRNMGENLIEPAGPAEIARPRAKKNGQLDLF